MIHCGKLLNNRKTYFNLLRDDPAMKKKATQKAKEDFEQLQTVHRYIVMNPRTCQMATCDWLNKHIVVVDGIPKMKKNTGKTCPHLLTLAFTMHDAEVELGLRLDSTKPFLKVRCYDIRNGCSQAKIQFLMNGWEHMGAKDSGSEVEGSEADEEEGVQSEAESMCGDEQGVEGQGRGTL